MGIALLPYEAVAIAAICKAMRGSNLQLHPPSYTRPSFWSKALFISNYLPVPPKTGWTPLVRATGLKNYVAVIKQYVATSRGDLITSGLEFRMLFDGIPMTSVSLAAGVEMNKSSASSYPVTPRNIFLPVNDVQSVEIQVKNETINQQIAIGLLSGWYFDAMDSSITSNSNAIIGTVYRPFIGVPNAD